MASLAAVFVIFAFLIVVIQRKYEYKHKYKHLALGLLIAFFIYFLPPKHLTPGSAFLGEARACVASLAAKSWAAAAAGQPTSLSKCIPGVFRVQQLRVPNCRSELRTEARANFLDF